jgi:hypothetical protein
VYCTILWHRGLLGLLFSQRPHSLPEMIQNTQPVLVNDSTSLRACLADLYTTPPRSAFAMDLEGVDLSRIGRLSTLQIYADRSSFVWIVDVTTLKATAFDEKDDKGRNLRRLLEDKNIKKVIVDLFAFPTEI